ncbi:MAG: BREX-1 system adenine-specific DNA-methyltransferase PglX [Mesorhizobium sp.]|nr:MAG: BREX-1 system adenine-specific DNA-methyltransferase PglX [Mesorhizobium sp.]
MNRSALKTYAPKARSEFIAGVTARAAKFGITKDRIAEATPQGDLIIIGAEAFSRGVGERRKKLLQRIALDGFEQTMEEVAYTWFNRFLAIRFMELHGYLEHGYRVLSHPGDKELPEILEHAEHLELPGLDKAKVIDLKLDGTKDADLYRLLLIAQCNALHRAMPFLFEKIDDETELLLPDNLLHTDSLIRKLVSAIDEADWQEIEIIGWLYQFYISEKKDEVIGKVVKSEDIPAATQLFTPNWIVKYMVQNALGAQWLATYPNSPLKAEMQYYVEPAEQTEEVKRQLAEITPKELNPEELTLIDPACGSGHILVEAYDLFKAIYLERGYRLRDVPRLILEKNLYGLDIDDRAAQMAGFALLMKARADDRRIFSSENAPVMHVMAIQDSKGLDAMRIVQALLPNGRFELLPSNDLLPDTLAQPTLSAEQPSPVQAGTIAALLDVFLDAKSFGSLVKLPKHLVKALPALQILVKPCERDDIFRREAKQSLRPLVEQAELLSCQYDAVVANPPYMGEKYYEPILAKYLQLNWQYCSANLFLPFIIFSFERLKQRGFSSIITLHNWMFLSDFTEFRRYFIGENRITNLAHLGAKAFPEITGEMVQSVVFSISGMPLGDRNVPCFRLVDGDGEQKRLALLAGANKHTKSLQDVSSKVDGCPLLYWFSEPALNIFAQSRAVNDVAVPRAGLTTGNNPLFQRYWFEVAINRIGFGYSSTNETAQSAHRWYPCYSSDESVPWYDSTLIVVDWEMDGLRVRNYKNDSGKIGSRAQNTQFYFQRGINWNKLGTSLFKARISEPGAIFDDTARSAFPQDEQNVWQLLGILNSKVGSAIMTALNPSMSFTNADLCRVPFRPAEAAESIVKRLVELRKEDVDSIETSFDFSRLRIVSPHQSKNLEADFAALRAVQIRTTQEMKQLEEQNNAAFIASYRLGDELTPEVSTDDVALFCNPQYRYEGSLSEEKREANLRSDAMRELCSYAVGCMVGRYSLSEPGLIYAGAGNSGFDRSRYGEFAADEDGIIPVTEMQWFDDDAATRFEAFLKVSWSPETLRENMRFVAECLADNGGIDPQKAIRSYFAKTFFKDHLKTYRRRPIYWLFSSGKLKAFECLVYLHRYNDSTLSRMRMEYVVPLQSRMAARIDQLGDDVASASSSAARTKAQKEKDLLARQLEELRAFDEELRHYADQRIALDLDDGVKVNYGKFGNLLAERKAVTGEK